MMSEPKRIRKVIGGRTPDGAVFVGPPNRWGIAYFSMTSVSDALGERKSITEHVATYRENLLKNEMLAEIRAELAGRDLACGCAIGAPCHADVLLELANGEPS